MFANTNILTDDECETLINSQEHPIPWNKEYELCAGKKHQFPKSMISFTRKRKRKSSIKEEIQKGKEGLLHVFCSNPIKGNLLLL